MLTSLDRLGIEAKYLDRARKFYEGDLELTVTDATDERFVCATGATDFVVRRPSGIPRGGLHTHFAFSIPAAEYGQWWERLSASHDLEEHRFGSASSLYLYDPDGNCVELGQSDVTGPGIDGIFEVVLEVASLERALVFYEALGFEPFDSGGSRRRVRLTGPMDLELWEPQLGLADARGGVHVELAFGVEDVEAVREAIEDQARSVGTDGGNGSLEDESASEAGSSSEDGSESEDGRFVVRDPDGHHLTFRSS